MTRRRHSAGDAQSPSVGCGKTIDNVTRRGGKARELLVERERLPDPGPGVAYTFQLIGLSVRTADGRVLGTLEDVIATGANPVYVVRGEREWLVPASPGVVQHVDMEARTIIVVLPAGLEDLS